MTMVEGYGAAVYGWPEYDNKDKTWALSFEIFERELTYALAFLSFVGLEGFS